MEKKINPGDIIIFEAGDSWLSKSIAWLTRSTVSHAAMVLDSNQIVEMGANGISVSTFDAGPGTSAHILRLNPELPHKPLLDAAAIYVDGEVGYDFPALILLAGLLIYRDIRPTPRWRKATDLILTGACVALDKLLNYITHKGTSVRTMVCSQLVYQIYLDCGNDYVIRIENLLDKAVTTDLQTICLADMADSADSDSLPSNNTADLQQDAAPTSYDTEAICKELYDVLTETESADVDMLVDTVELGGMVLKVQHFMDLLERILEKIHLDIPIPALFITPADIYLRAENLQKVDDCDIVRRKMV